MAARYGAGSARGRRVTGSDAPLLEPIGKGWGADVSRAARKTAAPKARSKYARDPDAGARSEHQHYQRAWRKFTTLQERSNSGQKISPMRSRSFAPIESALPEYGGRTGSNWEFNGNRRVRKGIGMSALKNGAKAADFNAKVAGALVKPKIASGIKTATSTPRNALITGAVGGTAVGGLVATGGMRRQQPQPTFGKADSYRRYDPEGRRQRRLGMGESALALGGGYAGHKGFRGIQAETKALRASKLRTEVGKPDVTVERKIGRKAIAVSRRNGLLFGGGAAAVGAAGALHHYGNTNRGRTYR